MRKRKYSGHWCSVPQCKNNEKTSFHYFPKDRKRLKEWIVACKLGKKVTSTMGVCGQHFRSSDFMPVVPGANQRRHRLKNNVVPSLNLPVRKTDRVKTTKQLLNDAKRLDRLLHRQNMDAQSSCKEHSTSHAAVGTDVLVESENVLQLTSEAENFEINNIGLLNKDYNDVLQTARTQEQDFHNEETQTAGTQEDADNEEAESRKANEIYLQLLGNTDIPTDKNVHESKNKYNFINLLATDSDLKSFTGITHVMLQNLKNCVLKCEKKNKNHKYVLSTEERIVLCLCKLKLNLSFLCLSVLFSIERHTCSNLFFITLNTLAFILKDAIYWPSKEEILKNMPKCFSEFKQTYIILDCTEIPVERPKCLQCRLRLYSHYKGCETIKFLIGIAPSGLITYISEPYGGRASDKAIFVQSKLLDKLTPTRDAVMVDKGFSIEEECALARIQLIIPPKLGKKKQFSPADVNSTVKIASARVHIERAIQRLKVFAVFKTKINIELVPYMRQVSQVVAGLVNLSEPILADKRF